MKHIFGLELSRRETLAVTVFEQRIHLGPRFLKTPEVNVRACDGLFFLPQRAVPERSLMHALPFEPFVAFPFRLLPGVEHSHRHPGIFI